MDESVRSPSPVLWPSPNLRVYSFDEVGKITKKSFTQAKDAKKMIEAAGFENVEEEILQIPLTPWHEDLEMKKIGMWQQLYADTGVEGHGLAILTRVLGVCWTIYGFTLM